MRLLLLGTLFVVFPSLSYAQTSAMRMSAYPEEDIAVHEQSLNFLKRGFPNGSYTGAWIGKTKTLLVSSSAQYRHMPAMLVAGFGATKKTDQENAFKWLEVYECENYLACTDFEQFLNANIQSHKNLNPVLKTKAGVILEKVQARIKTMGQVPSRLGFCPLPVEQQAQWLNMAYPLYCPPYDIATNPRNCAMLTPKPQNCSATEGLFNSLKKWSGQDALSSSRLLSMEQSLKKSCESEWTVAMTCESAGQQVKTEFACKAQLKKYPAQVDCQPKTH